MGANFTNEVHKLLAFTKYFRGHFIGHVNLDDHKWTLLHVNSVQNFK